MSDSLRPVDCSPPSSSIHGILQARILEWVAIPSAGDLPDPGIKPGSPTLQADPLTSAPPGKPLNTRIQESEDLKDFKGGAEARLKEEGGGGGRGGGKRGGLTDVSCHLQMPRHYGTFPWASREGRTGTRPYQKLDQNRTRIQVLCQEEVISLQPLAQAEGPLTRFLSPGPGD